MTDFKVANSKRTCAGASVADLHFSTMSSTNINALLDRVPGDELVGLLHGLRVFAVTPDDADEWRRRILARLALLRLPDDLTAD